MFTPIDQLNEAVQARVLASLDVTAEWEATWDIGLTDPGDSYPTKPLWGRVQVDGRWPAAFPLGHHADPRPWRETCEAPSGYTCPHALSVDLATVGVRPAGRTWG